ncbi:MAG: serine/threonine protein kinase [Blastocatellia bacterium]|nr:serine/threonine protein kinase [Blastocatellia bacterium]
MRELALHNCRIDARYDVKRRLGNGSYAEIFVATDTLASPQSPHNQVVIKALNVFMQDDLDVDLERTLVENFQNEAIALDRVRHPNVISRLGHGTARDLSGAIFHYLVLEYLSGGDLQHSGVQKKLPIDQVLRYIEQICAGLAYAHRLGVIHRDVKPQNLLLTTERTTVKIADFGVARFSVADSPITRVGTNVYAPPEHSPLHADNAVDTGAQVTPASDVYSLAKTLYALITGESPRAFANRTIDSLPEHYCDLSWSDALVKVIRGATDTDPNRRPQSVEEFWRTLEPVRNLVADEEAGTLVRKRDAEPQPHVARGYTPIAPQLPSFEPTGTSRKPSLAPPRADDSVSATELGTQNAPLSPFARGGARPTGKTLQYKSGVSRLGRAVAAALIAIFIVGALIAGIVGYVGDSRIFAGIADSLRQKTATANTDIFLRSGPDAENARIGLVTRNSRVRIMDSKNNWYHVDVIEQGRDRSGNDLRANRGWLNGKHLVLNNN